MPRACAATTRTAATQAAAAHLLFLLVAAGPLLLQQRSSCCWARPLQGHHGRSLSQAAGTTITSISQGQGGPSWNAPTTWTTPTAWTTPAVLDAAAALQSSTATSSSIITQVAPLPQQLQPGTTGSSQRPPAPPPAAVSPSPAVTPVLTLPLRDVGSSNAGYYTQTGYPVAVIINAQQKFCSQEPCRNGGACVPTGYGFFCQCSKGWSGPLCQQPVAISVHDALNEPPPRLAPLAGGVQGIPGFRTDRPDPGQQQQQQQQQLAPPTAAGAAAAAAAAAAAGRNAAPAPAPQYAPANWIAALIGR